MRDQDFQDCWRVEMLPDTKLDESPELRCRVDGEVRDFQIGAS